MAQETGKFREGSLDQFYTLPSVAAQCIACLRKHAPPHAQWIEPSAGSGSFLVEGALAYDIDPKDPLIQKADFLTVEIPEGCVIYGNPPFGRQSSLAKKFIRHAAERASIIAFVLPRSFTKPSMQTAFPLNFHCMDELTLPENSFTVNGAPHDVPCVFQVWVRKNTPRESLPHAEPSGFSFVKATDLHTIVFRRVGVNAGKCSFPANQSPQSHYFIQLDDPSLAATIVEKSESYPFPSNTTGPRSLSKREATLFLNTATAR
jgi:hypothetical protein